MGCAPELVIVGSTADFDSTKKTLLLVSHEASRTGAPILCLNIAREISPYYNLVTLLLNGGALVEDFTIYSNIIAHPKYLLRSACGYFINNIIDNIRVDFALVNCVVSSSTTKYLARAGIPTVSLVHEFASYIKPISVLQEMIDNSSEIVFSASIILNDAKYHLPNWKPGVRTHILPQGSCDLSSNNCGISEEVARIENVFRPADWPVTTKVVIGVGSFSIRKGVDLFIQCAQSVISKSKNKNIRFIWIGGGYREGADEFSIYIGEHIRRAGLARYIDFIDEVKSISMVYQRADLMLLTSRLDPLPNVGIDSIVAGLPIICFDNASGIADILKEDGFENHCISPYLDIETMSRQAIRILEDTVVAEILQTRLAEVGRSRFDLQEYVSTLSRLLEGASPINSRLEH